MEDNRGRPTTCKYCKHQFHVQDRIKWEKEKHPCPLCSEIWSDKPETERMLMILQDEYFKKRSEKILNEMIKILQSYCSSIIKKFFSNKIQEPGKLEYYTHTAVASMVEHYLKNMDFKVEGSFKGMLFPRIQAAIWGKQEYACAQESLDFEFDDGHSVSHADTKKSVMDSLQDRHSKEQLVKKLCEIIFGIGEYCSQEEDYIRLLNYRNYIVGGEKYTDKFFNSYKDKTGKLKFIQTLDITRKELMEMDAENN
jgi:hypothetical protein